MTNRWTILAALVLAGCGGGGGGEASAPAESAPGGERVAEAGSVAEPLGGGEECYDFDDGLLCVTGDDGGGEITFGDERWGYASTTEEGATSTSYVSYLDADGGRLLVVVTETECYPAGEFDEEAPPPGCVNELRVGPEASERVVDLSAQCQCEPD